MSERLTILFDKHFDGQLTTDERVELMGLFLEPALQPQLHELVEAAWARTGEEEGMPEEKNQALFQKIFEPVEEKAPVIEMAPQPKTAWKRWVAAASVLLMVALGAYLAWPGKKELEPIPQTATNDIKAPETNRAMITLANGEKVYLDSAANGSLATQGSVQLMKLANGKIIYEGTSTSPDVTYNTLNNPRGSKVIDMTLADGSRVWLNASSSVTYPVAFIGNERNVAMTGEAYFEVVHDESKPFHVSKGDVSVQVLGTHFNVNAYDDESDIKVTLLEGSVKVSNDVDSKAIKPGEQAAVLAHSPLTIHKPDLDEVMAWKNGLFSFIRADIKTVMRQIGRWYDVEVEYKGTPTRDVFGGDFQRDLPLSKVLDFLQKSQVHFVIEGRRLTVMP